MRALTLDFRRSDRPSRWVGLTCLALAFAAATAAGIEYRQIADDIAGVEASMRGSARAARKPAATVRTEGDVQRVALEVKHASDIMHQLNLPWDELLASVEAASIADIALLSIDSDVEHRRINISGEAKNLPAMLEYLRSLQARPTLAEIYLQSHEIQEQDPQRPVRFVLSANWLVRK